MHSPYGFLWAPWATRKGLSDGTVEIWRKEQLLLDGLTRNFFSEMPFEKIKEA